MTRKKEYRVIKLDKKYNDKDIPNPLRNDKFNFFQEGVYDSSETSVFINEQKDFAFLSPQPLVDYSDYLPRVKKVNLQKYKNKDVLAQERYLKVCKYFSRNINTCLEMGASEGAFLRVLNCESSGLKLFAIEPDQNKFPLLEEIIGTRIYRTIEDICRVRTKFDIVCMFHVLEHVLDPGDLISKIVKVIHKDSLFIIEVPSLKDPLLSLYNCESYRQFYFQKQHPYIYSEDSLRRLMECNGFETKEVINHQRYGLENHLNWLINGTPGGNVKFTKIFNETNKNYKAEIEGSGKTDSVIWVGRLKRR